MIKNFFKSKSEKTTVTIDEAKKTLNDLLAQVKKGQEITITDNNRPVARLVPMSKDKDDTITGKWTSDDFDIQLDDK